MRSISNQFSAMLNHTVRYYNLPSNPMSKVDRMELLHQIGHFQRDNPASRNSNGLM